ncbi:dehydrogenase [Candidatus Latescibacterota bacterium]
MIRSRAPLRLGLGGGGTDVSPFSDEYGGCTINTTINMYVYCSIEQTTDGTIEFHEADSNRTFQSDAKLKLELDNTGFDLQKGVYNRIVKDFAKNTLSFKMTTYSDAGPGSGLGGSSTFVVAMLQAYTEWLNLPLGKYDIARLAYEVERIDVGFVGGKQDHYAATFGGFNFMEFYDNRVIINPLNIKPWIINELETLMLIYCTESNRESAKIIEQQIQNTKAKNTDSLEAMKQLKHDAVSIKKAILFGDLDSFSQIMNRSWEAKKRMAVSISNSRIEAIIRTAKEAGAMAGKVSGAGGGGYMLFLVAPDKRTKLMRCLKTFGGSSSRVMCTNRGAEAWKI